MSGESERDRRTEDLVAFLQGELGPRKRRTVERTLARSPEARHDLEEIRRVLHAFRDAPLPEGSPALERRLLESVRAWRRSTAPDETVPARMTLRESLGLYREYFRYRIRTSAGFRILTVGTAIAVHALLLALVAGITVVTIRERRQVTEIFFPNPDDQSTASTDEESVLPKIPWETGVIRPDPVIPELVEHEFADARPEALADPRDFFGKIPDELPRNPEDRIRLTRWVLFARLPGPRRDDLLAKYGGSERTEAAVARGLAWLARTQESDGHWDAALHGGYARYDVGVTALAVLAFLGAGEGGSNSTHAEAVDRAIRYLLAAQEATGLIGGDEPFEQWTYLYNHAAATQALLEAYLLSVHRRELRDPVTRALERLVDLQNQDGGWRYTKRSTASDASVTSWALTTLALARRAGLLGDHDEAFERARAWLRERTSETGFTGYRRAPLVGERPLGTTAAAFSALAASFPPVRGSEEKRRQERALLECARSFNETDADLVTAHLLGNALFQLGGPAWTSWNERIAGWVVETQDVGGSWPSAGRFGPAGGRVAATALAVLTLEIYYRYPRFLD